MKSIKILFVNTVGYIGGAESSLIQMLKNLPPNIKPALLCPESSPLAKEVAMLNIPIFDWPFERICKWQFVKFYKGIRLVCNIINQNDFDIIHANTFQSAVHISYAAKLNHIPMIAVVHDIGKFSRVSKWLLNLSDKIVVVSRATGRNLIDKSISAAKLIVIPNGFDFDIIESLKNRKIPPEDGGNIVYVGQLSPIKGIDVLLEAFTIVREERSKARLTIIGDDLAYNGKYQNEYIQISEELRLVDSVEFKGYVKDVFSEFDDKDVFVMPSRSETFGRAIVEAMAYGLPVVATAVEGIPEIITSSALGELVPPENPEALAAGIIKILTEGGTKSPRSIEGSRYVKSEFPIKKIIARYMELYQNLLEEHENRR